MFESGKLPPNYDYFRCVVNIPEDVQRVGEPSEAGEQVSFEYNSKNVSRKIELEKILIPHVALNSFMVLSVFSFIAKMSSLKRIKFKTHILYIIHCAVI